MAFLTMPLSTTIYFMYHNSHERKERRQNREKRQGAVTQVSCESLTNIYVNFIDNKACCPRIMHAEESVNSYFHLQFHLVFFPKFLNISAPSYGRMTSDQTIAQLTFSLSHL